MRAQTSRMRGGRGGWKVCPIVTPAQRNGGGGRFCPIVTPSTRVRWREAGYEGDGERIAYTHLCTAKMCYICLFYWEKKENSPCFQANSLDKSFQILKKLLTLQQNIEYTEKKAMGTIVEDAICWYTTWHTQKTREGARSSVLNILNIGALSFLRLAASALMWHLGAVGNIADANERQLMNKTTQEDS